MGFFLVFSNFILSSKILLAVLQKYQRKLQEIVGRQCVLNIVQ